MVLIPRSVAPLLHAVALASLTNSFRLLNVPGPIKDFTDSQYGGHFVFLTVQGLAVSWATFVFALLHDVFPSIEVFNRIKKSLAILIVPTEGIITVLYWGMTFYDPSLLLPPDKEFHLPLSLDIGLHALPAIFLWLDFLLFSPRMSKQTNPLLISALSVLGYTSWMEHAATKNFRFPYPFLDGLDPKYRSAFYLAAIPLLLSLFYLANAVHDIVSSGREDSSEVPRIPKVLRLDDVPALERND